MLTLSTAKSFPELIAEIDVVLATNRMRRICQTCGASFGFHCGWDERCPNPLRHEKGQPYFLEGMFFSAKTSQCHAAFGGGENPERCSNRAEPSSLFCQSCNVLAEEN